MLADRMIDVKEVAARLSVSVPTIHRWAANGKFPKPVRLGSCSRWPERKVAAWLDEKVAAQA